MKAQAGVIVLQIVAAFASYLMLMLPVAGAVQIRIYDPFATSFVNTELEKLAIITYDVRNSTIEIRAVNSTQNSILEEAKLYRCRDNLPDTCVSTVSPTSHETLGNSISIDVPWVNAADQTSTFPQNANLMLLVRVARAGGIVWQPYWHRIQRTSASAYNHFDLDLARVDVFASQVEHVQRIKTYVDQHKEIPFTWVSIAEFVGAGSLYRLQTDDVSAFTTKRETTNRVEETITKDREFVFPANGVVANGITLRKNPSNLLCGGDFDGNGNSLDPGEDSTNCCYDAGCLGGQYCDAKFACEPVDNINLGLAFTPDTRIANCFQSHTLDIFVKVLSPPTGMQIVGQKYKLGAQPVKTFACEPRGANVYRCPVVVPADPACGPGTYTLGPNSITFDITYFNGPSTNSKTITTPFPNVVVGSYDCGNNICETNLGENANNCCYDCNCGANQYCDYQEGTNKTSGVCKADITSSNLVIKSVNPSRISPHNPTGDRVVVTAEITNKPSGFSLGSASCPVSCQKDGSPCSANCSVASCTQIASSNPTAANISCITDFRIDSYNLNSNYTLIHSLNLPITYNDGGRQANKTLQQNYQVNVPQSFCGNLICGFDEDSSNCCFDCGCGAGAFCSSRSNVHASSTDVCGPLTGVSLDIESVSPTDFETFTDTAKFININISVPTPPGGATILPSVCSFNEGPYCSGVSCSAIDESGKANCTLTVPAFDDYRTLPTYDPATKAATFSGSVNLSLQFNDGSRQKIIQTFSKTLPSITMRFVYHPGNGICETELSETQVNGCLDCGCSSFGEDFLCIPGGQEVRSICISKSNITLFVPPAKATCQIQVPGAGGKCIFDQFELSATIFNPPSGLQITQASYLYKNQTRSMFCRFVNETLFAKEYRCPIAFEPIEGGESGSSRVPLQVSATVKYTINPTIIEVLNASTSITVNKVKSSELLACEEKTAELEDAVDKLEAKENELLIIQIVLQVIAAAFAVACFLGCGRYCCVAAIIIGLLAALIPIFVGNLDKYQAEVQKAARAQADACGADTLSELRSSNRGMDSAGLAMIGISAAIAGAAGFGLATAGSTTTASPGTGPPPVFDTIPADIAFI